MMHGSIYLLMKTIGVFHNKVRKWAGRSISFFILAWIAATIATLAIHPHMIEPFHHHPIIGIFPLLSLGSIGMMIWKIRLKQDERAFFYSCLTIFFLLLLFVIGTFPNIAYSTINPEVN